MSRMKRVTDPLDEKAKARLIGGGGIGRTYHTTSSYYSSGSEHDAGVSTYGDNVSPCLSDLVNGFFEESYDDNVSADTNESTSSTIVSTSRSLKRRDFTEVNSTEKIDFGGDNNGNGDDAVRNIILFNVLKAINVFSCLRSNKQMYRRNVMYYLRNVGLDAAVCKTNWESCGGLTGGSYEYIDVSVASSQKRYLVDLDFEGEFVIARPSENYTRLLGSLPRVFVGRDEELKRIIKVMSDAAKRSLKGKDLHFPPWRKSRYMFMKWLGPYRRTTNLVPTNNSATDRTSVVKYRSVGFETDVKNGRYFVDTRR